MHKDARYQIYNSKSVVTLCRFAFQQMHWLPQLVPPPPALYREMSANQAPAMSDALQHVVTADFRGDRLSSVPHCAEHLTHSQLT